MKSYKYTQLEFGDYGSIHLYSTDSQLLDWILTELKKVITNFRVSGDLKLPSGEKYYLCIAKLQDKGFQAGWWILRQLCLQRWEPFAVTSDATIAEGMGGYYHIRLEGNAK